jgi:hypothetical protein
MNTDGAATTAAIADTSRVVASLVDIMQTSTPRIARLENIFKSTIWYNPSIPVYWYSCFSTYSQAQGQWYANNDAQFVSSDLWPILFGAFVSFGEIFVFVQFLGVNPSSWGDGNAYVSSIPGNKVSHVGCVLLVFLSTRLLFL